MAFTDAVRARRLPTPWRAAPPRHGVLFAPVERWRDVVPSRATIFPSSLSTMTTFVLLVDESTPRPASRQRGLRHRVVTRSPVDRVVRDVMARPWHFRRASYVAAHASADPSPTLVAWRGRERAPPRARLDLGSASNRPLLFQDEVRAIQPAPKSHTPSGLRFGTVGVEVAHARIARRL